MLKNKKILIVAAHPDDEILGCAGTIAKLIKQGAKAYTLILGEGVTSRVEKRSLANQSQLKNLQQETKKANQILGIKKVFTHNLPDNRFDSVDLLDIVKQIEAVLQKIKPETIFTHFKNDLNIDHQLTFQAVLTAARPLPGHFVKEIYAFETLSSTEYAYPLSFQPDTFVDISKSLNLKLKAMAAYQSELRKFPHPRSLEMIKLNAQYWGVRTGLKYAEAFQTIRFLAK